MMGYCAGDPVNRIDPSGNIFVSQGTFTHWFVPLQGGGYDLGIVGRTDELFFPSVEHRVVLEARFSQMSSAGELGTPWRTIDTFITRTISMTVGQGSSATVELSGKRLKDLADEGVCNIRITFAGQNSPFVLFSPPAVYSLILKRDGTLVLPHLQGPQRGNYKGPSHN